MSESNTGTTTIGKYEINAELGRGGMGVVYKAWEDSLQRFVAIKMLGDQLTHDETVVQRFLREARAVADLNHPNVVQVFAVDTYEGRPYFAMEYVEGESLTDLIKTAGQVNPRRAAQIIKEAAAGLAAAHAKDVVHRDIKPDNIMLTRHGGVKVVDFGIAKMDDPDSKLTATGMMVGTPNYISPEVCLGQDVDARSDIFSLGIVFYEMLAGTTPFNADSPIAMMTAVVQAEIPDIKTLNAQVDDNLRSILTLMLMKEPQYRYANSQQIIEDLTDYLAGRPPAHALAAAADATVVRERPELMAPTKEMNQPSPAPAAAPVQAGGGGKRLAQLGWVVGLLLIVGAAAGSWLYVEQPQQGNPEMATADTQESKPDEATRATEPLVVQPVSAMKVQDTAGNTSGNTSEDTAANTSGDAAGAAGKVAQESTGVASAAVVNTSPTPEPVEIVPVDASPLQPASRQPSPAATPEPVVSTGPPKLVVIAQGDPAVASVLESVLEGALADADYPVMDENFFDGFNFSTSMAQLGNNVLDNGADILVYADVRQTGQRQLQFYGRTERQTTANVEVRALLLREKRNLGAPWSNSLEYVPLNASENTREVATPIASELVERLNKLSR